jgi:hypothetical protein
MSEIKHAMVAREDMHVVHAYQEETYIDLFETSGYTEADIGKVADASLGSDDSLYFLNQVSPTLWSRMFPGEGDNFFPGFSAEPYGLSPTGSVYFNYPQYMKDHGSGAVWNPRLDRWQNGGDTTTTIRLKIRADLSKPLCAKYKFLYANCWMLLGTVASQVSVRILDTMENEITNTVVGGNAYTPGMLNTYDFPLDTQYGLPMDIVEVTAEGSTLSLYYFRNKYADANILFFQPTVSGE